MRDRARTHICGALRGFCARHSLLCRVFCNCQRANLSDVRPFARPHDLIPHRHNHFIHNSSRAPLLAASENNQEATGNRQPANGNHHRTEPLVARDRPNREGVNKGWCSRSDWVALRMGWVTLAWLRLACVGLHCVWVGLRWLGLRWLGLACVGLLAKASLASGQE